MELNLQLSYFKRLQTFSLTPLPSHVEFKLSPMKLAEAGFSRSEGCESDEVECLACGLKYSGWTNESPLGVHRILSQCCPFLNKLTSPTDVKCSQFDQINVRNELDRITKQQFSTLMSLSSQIIKVSNVDQPYIPRGGDTKLLYESLRLLTFRNVHSPDAEVYAEGGFAYNIVSKNVFCVFCDGELDFIPIDLSSLQEIHEEKYPSCPFANDYDVGNISRILERMVNEKTQNALSRFSDNKVKYLIKHPEFEEETARSGSFSIWPKMLTVVFPANEMANCGFFYTGFNDKVKCFSCGVGLYRWPFGAVPMEQHAKASPHCLFLRESKGVEFVSMAQNIELIVQADMEETTSETLEIKEEQDTSFLAKECSSLLISSQSSMPKKLSPTSSLTSSKRSRLTSSSPGSPTLDMDSIKAALACGWYPNEDLLIGTLKAADENYTKLCEKTQEVINTRAELQVTKTKKAVFQAELALFQAKEAHFQAKEAQFEAEKAAYQQQIIAQSRDLCRDLIVQQHREDLERKDQMIKEKDHILEQKDQMIEQNCFELGLKTKENEDLQRHIKSLQAALERCGGKDVTKPSHKEFGSLESETPADEFPVASCKVCLVKQSQIMFRPCKHLCCCDTCAAQLLLLGQNCPICREPFCREPNMGFEKVYVI